MRDHHNSVVVGFTGVLLVWAMTAGAVEPIKGVHQIPQNPVVPQMSAQQIIPSEPVEQAAPKASEATLTKVAIECAGIDIAATGFIFTDGFETGNTRAWEAGEPALFSAVRILDLDFAVRFAEGFSGDHLLHLKLLTPKGHHYQTSSQWMSADLAKKNSLRRVEGYPRPEAVQMIRKSDVTGSPEIKVSLPVGGTQIVTNSIYGTWTAEVYLDEQNEVCASRQFVLAP
jgi:hypothetical protein